MNYIDVVLIIILLFSAWTGFQRGFLIGILELLSWLLGFAFVLNTYSPLASFIQKTAPSTGIWAVMLAMAVTIIATRLLFSFLITQILKKLPSRIHFNKTNKALGVLPGIINGLLLALVAFALLSWMQLPPWLDEAAKQSRLGAKLTGTLEKMENHFSPALNDVNRSLSKIIIKPGSEKMVKLPFKVESAKPRPDLETKMLHLINKERKIAGLKQLKADPEITPVARKHSQDMFSRSYFSHVSIEGKDPFDRLRAGKVSFRTAGENLALAQTLHQAHTGLMNSPGHRANILHKSFGRVGIGILDGGIYGLMVTQNFRN